VHFFDTHLADKHQAVLDVPWHVATLEQDYLNRRELLARASSGATVLTLNASVASFIGRNLDAFIENTPAREDTAGAPTHDRGFARTVLRGTNEAVEAGSRAPDIAWIERWIQCAVTGPKEENTPVMPFLVIDTYPIERRLAWLLECLCKPRMDYFGSDKQNAKAILKVPELATVIVLHRLIDSLHGDRPLFSNLSALYGKVSPEISSYDAINKYAPSIRPHWPTIVSLGLTFREAQALVFGTADTGADLPLDVNPGA
jgi:hypothetical protein